MLRLWMRSAVAGVLVPALATASLGVPAASAPTATRPAVCYGETTGQVETATGTSTTIRVLPNEDPMFPVPNMGFLDDVAQGQPVDGNYPGIICDGHFYGPTAAWTDAFGGLGRPATVSTVGDRTTLATSASTATFVPEQQHFAVTSGAKRTVLDLGYPAAL